LQTNASMHAFSSDHGGSSGGRGGGDPHGSLVPGNYVTNSLVDGGLNHVANTDAGNGTGEPRAQTSARGGAAANVDANSRATGHSRSGLNDAGDEADLASEPASSHRHPGNALENRHFNNRRKASQTTSRPSVATAAATATATPDSNPSAGGGASASVGASASGGGNSGHPSRWGGVWTSQHSI
jgi:hypothetical protein